MHFYAAAQEQKFSFFEKFQRSSSRALSSDSIRCKEAVESFDFCI